MPIVKVHRYVRADAQSNPKALFIFGDNDLREGYGGQAGEMRGEVRAGGVRTKWTPGGAREDYFSDREYERCTSMIQQDLEPVREHLEKGGVVVVPADGVGTGLSRLPEKAPRIQAFIDEQLLELEDL